jgi:DNA replication and repair protein RecF
MILDELRADNFRMFDRLSLQAHCRLNVVLGVNAAGKSSLLEMIYLLGRGKSFRGSAPQELAGPRERRWTVFGRLSERASGVRTTQGLGWDADQGLQIRRDGSSASVLDLVQQLPVQILDPGLHRVLQEGPTYRRSFLDWGVFHVEPLFLPTWSRYRRALRQRNHALRSGRAETEVAAWEPELAQSGEAVQAFRLKHLAGIQQLVSDYLRVLLGEGEWSFELSSGWSRTQSLAEALEAHRAQDLRNGVTQLGPHRAELRIRVGTHAAKNRISRGQQKLLISALVLAQCRQIGEQTRRWPIVLVDDFGAELAEQYQCALMDVLSDYRGQLFVTAFEDAGAFSRVADKGMFHVEHGRLSVLSRP